jgi:hypothetical protein
MILASGIKSVSVMVFRQSKVNFQAYRLPYISIMENKAFVMHITIGCHGNKAFHNKKLFLTVFFRFLHNK